MLPVSIFEIIYALYFWRFYKLLQFGFVLTNIREEYVYIIKDNPIKNVLSNLTQVVQ